MSGVRVSGGFSYVYVGLGHLGFSYGRENRVREGKINRCVV